MIQRLAIVFRGLNSCLLPIISMVGLCFVLACGGEDDIIDGSLIGTWIVQEDFNSTEPQLITFFDDGHYLVYANCNRYGDGETEPLEIGTFSFSANKLVISSHIQNGCGGFDDDDAGGIPSGPIEISFSGDGNVFAIKGGASFERVANDDYPIVGSWNLPGGFNPNEAHFITFMITGDYYVYAGCNDTMENSISEPLEIGFYVLEGNVLRIDSHYQNGCGGFDSDELEGQPAGDINISFSEDGSELTLVDDGLTLTRVQ